MPVKTRRPGVTCKGRMDYTLTETNPVCWCGKPGLRELTGMENSLFTAGTLLRRDMANTHWASEKDRREINSTITMNRKNQTASNANTECQSKGSTCKYFLHQHQKSKYGMREPEHLALNGNPDQTGTLGMQWDEDNQWQFCHATHFTGMIGWDIRMGE